MKKCSMLLISALVVTLSAPAFAARPDGSSDVIDVIRESNYLMHSGNYDQVIISGRSNIKQSDMRVQKRKDGSSDSAQFFQKSKRMLNDGRNAKAMDEGQSNFQRGNGFYDVSQSDFFRDRDNKR